MKRLPKNWIEIFLFEDCRTITWLSKQTGIPYSTLYYKVANRSNDELRHLLSYDEYIKIENLADSMED